MFHQLIRIHDKNIYLIFLKVQFSIFLSSTEERKNMDFFILFYFLWLDDF